MKLIFTLSMPNVASWNGKWSGAGKHYAITRVFRGKKSEAKAKELIGSHYYNFGDGWGASINAQELVGCAPKSDGFCGYDWMVESLINYGKIMNDGQIEEHLELLKSEPAMP